MESGDGGGTGAVGASGAGGTTRASGAVSAGGPSRAGAPASTILLAMRPDLVERFFPPDLRAELDSLGTVVRIPADLRATDAAGPNAAGLDVATAIAPGPAAPDAAPAPAPDAPDTAGLDDPANPTSAAGIASALAAADVLITGWGTARIGAAALDAMPRLRGIVHSAGSVRAVVATDVYRRGIAVSSQAWANALSVAEYTLAMILLAAKGALTAQRRYRDSRRQFDVLTELAGRGAFRRRVGIIGASMIGRRVIELLTPFDLDVVLADPTLAAADAAGLGVVLLSLDELLGTSAVVSLHAPLLPGTVGMIGARELALLPDGAVFINTARGALVDQRALVGELRLGRIEAILDVTDPEVPEPASPLWDLPTLTLTPHIAGAAGTELHRLGASTVAEVGRVLRGEPLRHPVTESRYDSLA